MHIIFLINQNIFAFFSIKILKFYSSKIQYGIKKKPFSLPQQPIKKRKEKAGIKVIYC